MISTYHSSLSPLQRQGVEWLRGRERGYLADPPGTGKTRQLLAAVADASHVTVVCPAAIRDAGVWQDEAARIGFDRPVSVMSYHEVAKRPVIQPGALIADEAHHLRNRKVSWGTPAVGMSDRAERVYLASGTPMPNGNATELWGQLRLVRPGLPAYWPWVRQWFNVVPSRFTAFEVNGTLAACTSGCGGDCEHWQAFYEAEYDSSIMLRRPEVDNDLPPMAGADVPMWTKMTPVQARVYRDLKRELLAEIPEDGILLEALTASQKFVRLWQVSTGLSSADPEASDQHSGKLRLLEELLADRANPVLVVCHFIQTADALERLCERMGLRWARFGGATPQKARREAVVAFQGGQVDVLIGSVTVISEGLTLTAADTAVMLERSWLPDINFQAIKRVHRRGQDKPVTVRQLVTPNTVDSGQWAVVGDKRKRITRALTRAEVRALI